MTSAGTTTTLFSNQQAVSPAAAGVAASAAISAIGTARGRARVTSNCSLAAPNALRPPKPVPKLAGMAFIPEWRNFKRMQDLTVAAASLIYAAAVLNAIDRLPGGGTMVVRWTLLVPAAYLGFSLGIPLIVPPLRRWL